MGLYKTVSYNGDSTQRSLVTTKLAGREWKPGTVLMLLASFFLLLLAIMMGAVSWEAQYQFILGAKHIGWASAFEALGLDIAAVIFALLGLAKAIQGKSPKIERILNLACAGGSLAMNVMAGQMGSPRNLAVYALAPLLYAACSDRLIATVASVTIKDSSSGWSYFGTIARYILRLGLAPPSTAKGLRSMALAAAPLPGPGQPARILSDPAADCCGNSGGTGFKCDIVHMGHAGVT